MSRFQVLSPDGFPINKDKTYCCRESAVIACKEWIDRYEKQGYYSSNEGRIEFNNIWGMCSIVEEPAKSLQEYMDEEAVNNAFKDFNDVIYTAKTRTIIQQIIDEAIGLFELEQLN